MTMKNEVERMSADQQQAVSFSDAALEHLELALKKQDKCRGIRFSVSKTGCSGLSYVVDYVFEVNNEDKCFVINDWLIAYIDRLAYPYLKGMFVDYKKEGLNTKFVFTNPNQTGACGCGESFTIDEKFRD
jgi:iron-sulfur cluster assembly protein